MKVELTRRFDEQLSVLVDSLQITDVTLPDAFQRAILSSIEAQQNITQTQRIKENTLVAFESQVCARPLA